MVYAAFVAVWHAVRAARRSSALSATLSEARLAALEARMQPHFLFNALNTIAHLVRHDAPLAERAVVDLGELLRAALETGGRREVRVGDEFVLLERYLRIQRARFGDRLRITTELEPAASDLLLPPLLLQPLVENAIHHGIGARPRGGSLHVAAARRGERLELSVVDDGDASGADSLGAGLGSGLRATRERLALLYGDRHEVESASRSAGGTSVRIALPMKRAPSAPLEQVSS